VNTSYDAEDEMDSSGCLIHYHHCNTSYDAEDEMDIM
jgi:hypothetical protein